MNLRGIHVAQGHRARDEAHLRATFLRLVEVHQVRESDVSWSGGQHAPVTCLVCMQSWPFMLARRAANMGTSNIFTLPCPRTRRSSEEAVRRLRDYRCHPSHDVVRAPQGQILVCRRCGFYLTDTPHFRSVNRIHFAFPCQPLPFRPWAGTTFHDDWRWYLPHLYP